MPISADQYTSRSIFVLIVGNLLGTVLANTLGEGLAGTMIASFGVASFSLLNERELADLRRREMGSVFQQPTLLKSLNILDNIILPSLRGNRKRVRQINEKARSLMERTGRSELERRNITQASGDNCSG